MKRLFLLILFIGRFSDSLRLLRDTHFQGAS